jgi:glycosyltransferase involved in cell wall biosynthesis
MKVAIVHDWLTGMRGGEKCLEVFCELFPEATLFTLLHKKGSVSRVIEEMDIRTSFLQKIPGIFKSYRSFLPFFPMAIESFDLTGYDLVLSSSHCVAKGVRTPDALHICYCYTPVRYAWKFFNDYFSSENPLKRWIISLVLKKLKKWDINSNKNIDYFIAISDNVRTRIEEFYSRDADVIYPPVNPVDIKSSGSGVLQNHTSDEAYYLIVSALVPYKRVDLAVEAFSVSGRRLIVIGTGGELSKLQESATENITFLGWAGDQELKEYYSGCEALIFPGEEDFGIVPVEAQSYGKPVIAYAAGGVLETVVPLKADKGLVDGVFPTGVFFNEQTVKSLNDAIERFEQNKDVFKADKLRKNAMQFNRIRFREEIEEYIQEKIKIKL